MTWGQSYKTYNPVNSQQKFNLFNGIHCSMIQTKSSKLPKLQMH